MEQMSFGWSAFMWFVGVLIGWAAGRDEKPKAPDMSEFGGAIVYAWAIVGVICWITGAFYAPHQ